MSSTPEDLKYAESHEWISVSHDGTATVGITFHAQELLGDIVHVELPEVGADFAAAEEAAVVESVKAASDVYAPVSGEVIAVNEALEDNPELVNSDPYGDGWFFRVRVADEAELEKLLSAADYAAQCEDGGDEPEEA